MNQLTLPTDTAAELTMSSLEIAELVESRHDVVKQSIERLALKGIISLPPLVEVKIQRKRRAENINVYRIGKRDTYVLVAQLSPEFTAKLVDRWQELEQQTTTSAAALPDFTNPAIAARAWAEQYDGRIQAEKTKAQIGSRREATAMATASAATRKANKLEIELDKSKEYYTVKRMQSLYPGQHFKWRHLKKVAEEMELPPKDVFDANYGTVKAYHIDVWNIAYDITTNDSAELN